MTTSAPSFEIQEDAEIVALLRHLQQIVLEHPIAAQAAFSALVAEGRAFAGTDEGKRWQDRLAGSPLIEKGRSLWEATTFNLLEEDRSVVVPSRILDAFVKLTHEHNLEAILGRLAEENR